MIRSIPCPITILRVINKPIGLLEARPVNYLGKISYGVYLMHNFWVYFVFKCWPGKAGLPDKSPAGDMAAFGLVILLTIGSAILSYELFEKRFLRRARGL